jgi:hypothetical protein
MAGFAVQNNEHLIRSNLWSAQIKEVLLEELMGTKYVDFITDFPDGETINIPSIGQAEVLDYVENQQVQYTAMDTGNFTFTVDQYKQSATYITEKMKQDSMYAARLASKFVPSQARAIMKAMELKILSCGPDGQTASNLNAINGANHRFVGGGTNEVMIPGDFAKANYALDMANVPMANRVAIVHPSVGYALSITTNLTNISNNPRWEGIVRDGGLTGTKFAMNVYGFDVYTSQNVKVNTAAETINGVTAAAGVHNLFFSAEQSVLPFVGLIRQQPKVDSSYNKDFQREEYVTTARYAFKLYRPENVVDILTDTDQV